MTIKRGKTMSKEFKWTDELVESFSATFLMQRINWAVIHDASATPLPLRLQLEEFKQLHTPKPQAENRPDWDNFESNLNKFEKERLSPQPQKEDELCEMAFFGGREIVVDTSKTGYSDIQYKYKSYEDYKKSVKQ